jgi:hypothetical protein
VINGKNFDWENVEIFLDGVIVTDVKEINYTDEQEWEKQYSGGSRPIAIGRGNYNASGDITVGRAAYDELNTIARVAGKTVYDFKPGIIVVSYGTKTVPEDEGAFIEVSHSPLHTDTILNFVFSKRDFGIKQNDKGNSVKLEFEAEKIL